MGSSGNIVSCDKCPNSFTTDVLKRWLSKKKFEYLMENDEAPFECFSCEPTLGNFQEFQKKTKEFMSAFYGQEYEEERPKSPTKKKPPVKAKSSDQKSTPIQKSPGRKGK